ncbi:hypothetical protein LDENG_00280200 [Lucifuga dentata]|nr:hypothetical protein LDENG_00280200 [Lucifuga dentata]
MKYIRGAQTVNHLRKYLQRIKTIQIYGNYVIVANYSQIQLIYHIYSSISRSGFDLKI